jgi:ATP-dependent Clp endopeptidase proteolytic subunit ClpP
MSKKWYSISAKDDSAEIAIFDEIGGWGINAAQFQKDFVAIKDKKNIRVSLNSPGGDVFDGMTIYNIIAAQRERVTVEVLGLAASIVSIIALAGNRLIMAEGTYLMIHQPWSIAMGTADDFRKEAGLLDKVGDQFVGIYAAHSGLSEDEIKKAMADETWYTAAEAKEAGFVNEITEYGEAAASFDMSKFGYAHVPAGMATSVTELKEPTTIRELEERLRDAGVSRKVAKVAAASAFDNLRDAEEPEIDYSIMLRIAENEKKVKAFKETKNG